MTSAAPERPARPIHPPLLDTRPLVPFHVRHKAAKRRLAAAFAAVVGQATTAQHFDRALADLRRLGLHGPGLIVAAEHMAATQLRELVNGGSDRPGRGASLGAVEPEIRLDPRPKLAATQRGLRPAAPATA